MLRDPKQFKQVKSTGIDGLSPLDGKWMRAPIYETVFEDREAVKTAIFSYIEAYYNRERLHSSIGYLSPVIFEQQQFAMVA